MFDDTSFCIPPGGSNVFGALGHARAFLEVDAQVRNGEMPMPNVIVVGAGTCGTIAGLMAGVKLAAVDIKILGIRCVHPLVCNSRRVANLANDALAMVNSSQRVRPEDVDLRPFAHGLGYVDAAPNESELKSQFQNEAGITLDTTYTVKVVSALRRMLRSSEFQHDTVLYWHTFSPAALHWSQLQACQNVSLLSSSSLLEPVPCPKLNFH